MIRVNSRISYKANEWLDKRSEDTGLSKSALMMLAVENYIQQTQMMETMSDMTAVYNKLNEIEKKLEG